jgi:hypothetical protein
VSAVFLALWYIARLPLGFANSEGNTMDCDIYSPDEVIFHTFVVGSVLANKWLEDCNFTAKTWYVSGASLSTATFSETIS